ncbi:sigma-54-dependent Fis family transcriptional regulator [Marinomonas sp. M1K-6]|uniref:Sigma-54-dependent Fis family transcriptional regulator n=1 Tax=Marinomonas profundi TaxID=2726122 RepID=A0A847R740_9GAMM|nr:sigma-54 dependent transcriptional regulator [Marinomonas profundi]NLQ16070.1 sigma-54-dependent Fis family transcriptional regulator [Marinomonas profundi]UDV03342.1 sigma-54-dependent Fis family transcriptional regulator [Marinomonas profundi]
MENPTRSAIEVWLLDDDDIVRSTTAQWLRLSDYEVREFYSAQELLNQFASAQPCIIISDIRMTPIDGLTVMNDCLSQEHDLPFILITGHGDIDTAVSALRDGAFDFLEKPFDPNRLIQTVEKAIQQRHVQLQHATQSQYLGELHGLEEVIIGQHEQIIRIRQQIHTFASMDTHVIVYGKTGCGKELVAKALHDCSPRSSRPFVAINCAAIPTDLFESELFGHEAGAFTSANKQRIGKLEHASGGTLFLDEIESMPLPMQIKLLRVLQENQLERIGSNHTIQIDLRVVAAAKSDLQTLEHFRQDLFFRLNVSQIHLPELRHRGSDVPLLFEHFCRIAIKERGGEVRQLSPMDHETLTLYGWPGNVRELRNVALRYALDPNTSVAKILAGYQAQDDIDTVTPLPLSVKVQEFERSLIEASIRQQKGNIQLVLEQLQLPRRTLNQKMQKYGLNRTDYLS